MTLREQVGKLLVDLRGPVTRTAAADHLGIARQSLMKLETGGLSLDRLDELATSYGVEFMLVAMNPDGMQQVGIAPALESLLPAPPATS